jgi:acetylornithine deacetylase/succinyl-diaminopimelate desuccinylase-like protein
MAAPGENLKINGERLWDSLMEMAKIGPGIAGGNNRQTLTDEDSEGRHLFQKWCEEAGMTMGVDEIGNMFARREGTDPDALPVYVGSHLDTQPTGGKYDGVLGVLGGLEIIRTLNDLGIKTKHPIVVTNWTNEEGTRYAPAMLASGVFAGKHTLDWAYDRVDAKGKRFGDELERIGWKGEEKVGARKMHAFFELHIEQGPILEAEGKDIGVVTHGQGLRWIECTVTGKESHTGLHADAHAQERGPGPRAHHRAGPRDRDEEPAQRGGGHRAYRRLPQLAQHHPGQGRLHRRHADPSSRQVERDGRRVHGPRADSSARRSGSSSRRDRGAVRPARLRRGLRERHPPSR